MALEVGYDWRDAIYMRLIVGVLYEVRMRRESVCGEGKAAAALQNGGV